MSIGLCNKEKWKSFSLRYCAAEIMIVLRNESDIYKQ